MFRCCMYECISYVTGGICSHHPFMGSVSLLPFVAIKVYGSPWLTLCLPLSVAKDIQLTPRGNPNLNDALFSESFWMQLALRCWGGYWML